MSNHSPLLLLERKTKTKTKKLEGRFSEKDKRVTFWFILELHMHKQEFSTKTIHSAFEFSWISEIRKISWTDFKKKNKRAILEPIWILSALVFSIHGPIAVRCTIWYYLYNLKNVKNTHGGVLILSKVD